MYGRPYIAVVVLCVGSGRVVVVLCVVRAWTTTAAATEHCCVRCEQVVSHKRGKWWVVRSVMSAVPHGGSRREGTQRIVTTAVSGDGPVRD